MTSRGSFHLALENRMPRGKPYRQKKGQMTKGGKKAVKESMKKSAKRRAGRRVYV